MTHYDSNSRMSVVYRLDNWTSKYPGNKHSNEQFASINVSVTL